MRGICQAKALAREKRQLISGVSRLLHIKGLLWKQVKQLEPSLHCLRLRRGAGKGAELQYVAAAEPLGDVVRREPARRYTAGGYIGFS